MTSASNKVGWYCGLQGPFAIKAQALAICKPAVKVGYKAQEADTISYRVDKSIWKSPYPLVEKHRPQP